MVAGKWLTRWAYLWRWWIDGQCALPERTTICALFWRSVMVGPATAVFLISSAPFMGLAWLFIAVAPYIRRAWQWTRANWVFSAVLGPPARYAGAGLDLAGEYAKAAKQKMCPIVKLTR